MHDFLIKELGRAVPYGVYDLATNAGWVGVGQDHDTAAFAVQTIRRWWQEIGQSRYRAAPRLTITADGGGSNGVRVRLWKRELQKLCDETGLAITVHHLPPGDKQVERDRAPAVLVHQPELASNASGELSGDRRPDRGDHDQEYLTADVLVDLWRALDAAFDAERAEAKLSVQEFLKSRHPAWNLVGRVHFNLAENRRDEEAPFAFLATYTTRLSAEAKAQHLPLGKALQEYAGRETASACSRCSCPSNAPPSTALG